MSKIEREERFVNGKCYLQRGLYLEQLKSWLEFFPKEQFCIVKSENYFKDEEETMKKVFNFLGVYPLTNVKYPKPQMHSKEDFPKHLHEMLTVFFKPYNEELQHFLTHELGLDIELNWD